MKFRRIRSPDGSNIERQALRNGAWRMIENTRPAFMPEWELEAADRLGLSPSLPLLPIQPLSFRDFMLFERHAVDAARGYAKRFMPGAYRISRAYEQLSGKTFPKFKPAPLWYQQPIYYMGNHLAFVPSGAPVKAPSYTGALDYELELGFVLAQPLFNATAEEATQAIGAFVVLNDFSARDVQLAEMRSGFGPQKAKHFLSSMSDTAVTADEIMPRLRGLTASVRVNDRLIATPNLKGMRYNLGEALAHVSCEEHLFPGELFGTGTLPGGSGMETDCWLKPGDRLSLAIDGVGEIHHNIA